MTSLDEIIGAGANTPVPEKDPSARAQDIEPAASFDKSSGEQTTEQPVTAEPFDKGSGGEAVGEGEDAQKQVPLAALQAERAKAKRYTEQVASFEQQMREQDAGWQRRFDILAAEIKPKHEGPKPDFWDDPEAAIDMRLRESLGPVGQALAHQRQQFSEMQAVVKHGDEAVNAAYQAIASLKTSNPQAFASEYPRIMGSPHPYGALVEWHKQQQVLSEIGTDPAAYREKIRSELLAEMNAGSSPGAGGQANGAAMPSNFATARNAGNRSGPAWGGPAPLQDIFAKR